MVQVTPVVTSAAVEGLVDEAVLRRLIGEADGRLGAVHGKTGKTNLQKRIAGYNSAARFAPWIVLVDLDQEFDCAPPLCATWLPHPAPMMCFRVAVRETEAWLLADRERIAQFLSAATSQIPPDPEAERDPKATVINLARRSRRRDIREDIVPRPGSGRSVGPAYTSRMIEFAATTWRPEVAEQASDSLRRCRARLAELFGR